MPIESLAEDAAQQRIDFHCGRVRDLLETEDTGGKNQIDAGRTIIRNYVPVQATTPEVARRLSDQDIISDYRMTVRGNYVFLFRSELGWL